MDGAFILVAFYHKWSKQGTLLHTDTHEAEMKKKFKISDTAPNDRT
jgi:hypothetical protein